MLNDNYIGFSFVVSESTMLAFLVIGGVVLFTYCVMKIVEHLTKGV